MPEAPSSAEQVLAWHRESPRGSLGGELMGTINVHYFASAHCLLWQLRMPLGQGEGERPGAESAGHFAHQMIHYCVCKYFFL